MNKLNLMVAGGNKINAEDLLFLEHSIKDGVHAMNGILYGYGMNTNEGFKVFGCEEDAATGTVNITPGWLFIEGELYEFQGSTFTVPSGQVGYFVPQESDDPTSVKPLATVSGTSPTRKFRRAIAIASATLPASGIRIDSPLFLNRMISVIAPAVQLPFQEGINPWTNWSITDFAAIGLFSLGSSGQFRARAKRMGKTLHLAINMLDCVFGSTTSGNFLGQFQIPNTLGLPKYTEKFTAIMKRGVGADIVGSVTFTGGSQDVAISFNDPISGASTAKVYINVTFELD